MKKLNKNTSGLTGLEGKNPSQTIPANRYVGLKKRQDYLNYVPIIGNFE